MAIVLETEGSILSIQIQLKPISYAYINATQTTTHQRDMYIYMCYLFSSFYAGKVCVKSQTMHSVLKGGSGGG